MDLHSLFRVKALALVDSFKPRLTGELATYASFVQYLDAKTMTEAFHAHVAVPYGERVSRRDESLFAERAAPYERIMEAVEKLWLESSAADKESAWQYIDLLVKIARKAASQSAA